MIKPTLGSYKKLRLAASTIAGLDDSDLDAMIFDAGDTKARSHESTHDLLVLCATNLVNRSGPFPKPENVKPLFSRVFNRFLHQNQMPNIQLKDFYKVTIEEADNLSRTGWNLTSNGNGNDTVPLQDVLRGEQVNPRTTIISLLDSLHDFINFFHSAYQGSAQTYSESLSNIESPSSNRMERFKSALEELLALRGWGIALSANFIKDSQMPKLSALQNEERLSSAYSVYVKPDLHIIRFMANLTGRRDDFNGKLQDYSSGNAPRWLENHSWNYIRLRAQNINSHPQLAWNCIQDVNYWASQAKVPAVAIDRLLYMCGSGKFPGIARLMSEHSQQEDRYRTVFQHLGVSQ